MDVGVIVGTHGLRGDLKVQPLPTAEGALPTAQEVFLTDGRGHFTAYRVRRSTPHKSHILLRLVDREHIDAVTELVGQTVLMRRADLPEPDPEQLYWYQLEGLSVVDRRRGLLGQVAEMFSTAAHDILVVRSDQGEVLIPAVPPFIEEFDSDTGELHVDLPDGLVPFTDDL